LAFYEQFDEAEFLLMKIDRKDLAINLRMRLGEWARVLQMAQEATG
jgi:WD repeat-containing protein 35